MNAALSRVAGRAALPLAGIAAVAWARFAWDVPEGVLVQGAIIGALTSLLALGLALVWRANRIVNFAAGDLGAVPATLAVLLMISTVGLSWWLALATGFVASILLGLLVETLLVRRFFRSPRLVLTVATIGIAQLLAAAALFLPQAFELTGESIPAPFDVHFTIDPIIFRGNDVVALITIPLTFLGLALFLRNSDVGIAIRGGAERADRASTLGIPVRRLHTVVWVIASVLAFLAVFLRAGIIGLPIGEVLGPAILLRALAAAVIGGLERMPTIALAAVALGIVEQSVVWHWQEPAYVDPILFVVVLAALMLTGRARGRVREGEVSTWQAAREVRPIPRELRGLPEVRAGIWGLVALVLVVLLALPAVLTESKINLVAAILIFGIVGLSLVVLTGWSGQVSLGQMAFVGVGAAVGGALTDRLGWDLSLALVGGGFAGAVVATVIGLPALRRRGLTLAVTTLAFALGTSSYLLNRNFFGEGSSNDWLPGLRIERPALFGAIAIDTETRFYYLCLAALALAYAMVRGVRRSRTGRVLIAIRENERAAEAYGVSARRTTLVAFAFSGFLAAFAGVLFVHHQTGLEVGPYAPEQSLVVFSMTVIGGLGSIPGALLGAAYVRGTDYFLPAEWQVLATGVGLLLVLLVLPGGLGQAFADARDGLLRRVARRRGIVVPSLVADARAPTPNGEVPAQALDTAREVVDETQIREPAP